MSWSVAVVAAERLRDALAAEVERAKGERRLIRDLDADALFVGVAARSSFQESAGRIERELAGALAAIAATLGVSELTLKDLWRAGAPEAEPLCDALEDVRRLSGDLLEIDRVNRELTAKALACVNGYLGAVRPDPEGYDRRGVRPAFAAFATAGSATVSRRA